MGIREISCPESVGIDFGEHFGDPTLVEQGLLFLGWLMPGCICYCLRFQKQPGRYSWFVPIGENAPNLPPRIPFLNLLWDTWTWPILAQHEGALDGGYEVDATIAKAKWRGQIRLEAQREFVGYYKVVLIDDKRPVPQDTAFAMAAYRIRDFVGDQVWRRRVKALESSPDNKHLLGVTHANIDTALESNQISLALRHLATLITSHLGSWLNRIAVFVPTNPNTLECIYAHGGDGTPGWENIQQYVGTTLQSVEQLHAEVRGHPQQDPYSDAAAGANPIRIDVDSSCLLAEVWRARGDLRRLSYEREVPISNSWNGGFVASDDYGPCAAVFTNDDPWVNDLGASRPGEPLFVSRNELYFVIPWFVIGNENERRLLGLVVLDQSYWTDVDLHSDLVPRLRLARLFLDEFASHFVVCEQSGQWR